MRDTSLTVGARLLWWELVQWTTADLPECFVPQHAMVDALGVSRASVSRWLKELSDAGLVTRQREGWGNRYTLTQSREERASRMAAAS